MMEYIYEENMSFVEFARENGLSTHKGWDELFSEADDAWYSIPHVRKYRMYGSDGTDD